MAEDTTAVKKALSLMMGDTEDPKEGVALRILLLLILLFGIGLSGYAIYQNREYIPPQITEAKPQAPTADINRLNTMVKNLKAANDTRMRSMEVASMSASMARYPFFAENLTAEDIDHIKVIERVVVIPPSVLVRGMMVLDGTSAAVLDIEGEASGKIYRVGDRFAGSKGRVTRITPDKVTVIYENKEFTYTR